MASTPAAGHPPITLEEFLAQPEEKPHREYVDGRIEDKVSPRTKHVVIEGRLVEALNQFARPGRLGMAGPELRCTFGGRSIVPDVAFLRAEHLPVDATGEVADTVERPPDLLVEILSPGQAVGSLAEKIAFAIAHGSQVGWLVDPYGKTVSVYRVGRSPVRLGLDGELEGEPALPGFRLSVAELFGWLRV